MPHQYMYINYEFYRLEQYMKEYIDTMKPVTTKIQIEIWSKHGYIEHGHNGNEFPPFEIWKQLN